MGAHRNTYCRALLWCEMARTEQSGLCHDAGLVPDLRDCDDDYVGPAAYFIICVPINFGF